MLDGWFHFNLRSQHLIVTQGKTYIKLDDELSLSVSNFDVSGTKS
jgi:hypothetical protein